MGLKDSQSQFQVQRRTNDASKLRLRRKRGTDEGRRVKLVNDKKKKTLFNLDHRHTHFALDSVCLCAQWNCFGQPLSSLGHIEMRVSTHQQTSALVLIKAAEEKPGSWNRQQHITHKWLGKKDRTYKNSYDKKATQHRLVESDFHCSPLTHQTQQSP